MDRSTRQKINKETPALNDTFDKINLTDTYRTFYLKKRLNTHLYSEYYIQKKQNTLFSNACGTYSRRDHNVGNKSQHI